MAPTYDASGTRFQDDYQRLTAEQRKAFRTARLAMIEDLNEERGFRPGLKVKRVQGTNGVWEMRWAPDGRATFQYGAERRPGVPHVIWRRVGTHDIFRRP